MRYLTAVLIGMSSSLTALPMGNPAEPQIVDPGFWIAQDCVLGVKLGYEGDRITDRKMRAHGQAHGRIDQLTLRWDQGVVTFNYLDRIELYGSIGSTNGELSFRPHRDHQRRQFQTHNGWTAGGGGRFLLAQWGNSVIGIDGKMQWSNPGIKWAAVDGESFDSGGHLKYQEWQVSIAFSYTADWLTPYVGAKYSNVHATVSQIPKTVYPSSYFKMMNRNRFGIGVGATLSPGKKFDLFAEVQMIDEQALAFGGSLRF